MKVDEKLESDYFIEVYRRNERFGLVVEYDVLSSTKPAVHYVNFEWDWGPRIYMTGAEFWSIGAAGFAGFLCKFATGGLAAVGCSVAATALWNKVAATNSILSGQTCYGLSQAINIGWEVASDEKCG